MRKRIIMYSPYEWSPICKTYGIRYKLDEEGHFVVQRIGVDIEDKDKIMAKTEIEYCFAMLCRGFSRIRKDV